MRIVLTLLSGLGSATQDAINKKIFPGCVIGCVRKNGERHVLPFGHFTYKPDSPGVREDTVYDLASITKSIPTASLVLRMFEERTCRPADAVKNYLPELQNDFGATIEDLLMYRVRGPRLSELKDKTTKEILAHVFEHGFDAPPGKSTYTNLPGLLLGLITERAGGDSLDRLVQKYFFDPFRMTHTTFFPEKPDECVPTEIDDVRLPAQAGRLVQGVPHDESANVFAKAGHAVGHAGLFSTAPDLLNFLEMLLREPSSPIVRGAQKGLGWQTNEAWMGKGRSARTFGKTGFTGTSIVCDVERGIALVILSNRTFPKRPQNSEAINAFRTDIADIIYDM